MNYSPWFDLFFHGRGVDERVGERWGGGYTLQIQWSRAQCLNVCIQAKPQSENVNSHLIFEQMRREAVFDLDN